MQNAALIRTEKRRLRRQITSREREAASERAAEHALSYIAQFPPDWDIGIYLALLEEIDTAPLIAALRAQDRDLYLPAVIAKAQPLRWRLWRKDAAMSADILQIPVPALENPHDERNIAPQITVLPLVAYDSRGSRLGMGGGYYDRTFAGKTAQQRLLGLAYSAQHTEKLPAQPWDIPLDALANEQTLLIFTQGAPHADET